MIVEKDNEKILYVSFNQDTTCFAVGTETGFKIFNTYPFKLNTTRILGGGIAIVEMLYRSNILALVGGGKSPMYPNNKVILWDDKQQKGISELKFSSQVKNVQVKKDKIVIVCEQKIYVFSFRSFENLDNINTLPNPKGIAAINLDPKSTVLAYSDQQIGYVRVKCYDKAVTTLISAHESNIAFLSLNYEGTILATASDKGTLIRLFHTQSGKFLQELRRGKDKVDMHFICFDSNSKLLAATSDKGTIHIWSLTTVLKKLNDVNDTNTPVVQLNNNSDTISVANSSNRNSEFPDENIIEESEPHNQSSIFKSLPNFLTGGFFKSEWSFAQIRINEPNSICTFSANNNFVTITTSGEYYQATIDLKKGGECPIVKQHCFILKE